MSQTDDIYDLQRFVAAQAPVYPTVVAELTAGAKRSHWMWFIFPQISGLGTSATAQRYALGGLEEATAYLGHPLLGPRYVECTRVVTAVDAKSAEQIFGWPDHLKFHSSLTLFSLVPDHDPVIDEALLKYCSGAPDSRTVAAVQMSGNR